MDIPNLVSYGKNTSTTFWWVQNSIFSILHNIHDWTIYQTTFKHHKFLLLRQVDACLIQCEHEDTAQEIFLIIGSKLQLKNEDKAPFAYLGPCIDFNGVDKKESNTHIIISRENYIDRILCAYAWDKPKNLIRILLLSLTLVSRQSFKSVVLMKELLTLTNLKLHNILVIVLSLVKWCMHILLVDLTLATRLLLWVNCPPSHLKSTVNCWQEFPRTYT